MTVTDEDLEVVMKSIREIQTCLVVVAESWAEHMKTVDWLKGEVDETKVGIEIVAEKRKAMDADSLIHDIAKGQVKVGLLRNRLYELQEREYVV